MNIRRINRAAKYLLFIVSPFLSLPILIQDIKKGNKYALTLFAIFLSILSLLYIPRFTNDKAFYYQLYENLNSTSINEFLNYLATGLTDFIFYILIYTFSLVKIPLQYLFLIITFFTVKIWFDIYYKSVIIYKPKSKEFLLFFLFILFSFSLAGLFSGIRFYLSITLSFSGFFKGIVEEKKKTGFFMVLLAALTHFSGFVYLPAYLFILLFKGSSRIYKIIFLLSFIFLIMPRDFLLDHITALNLIDKYQNKAQGYLGETDYIENSIDVGNFNNFLRYFFKSLWVYFAYLYLYLTRKKDSKIKNIFYLTFAIANVFYSAPTVYNRYLILAQGFFILVMIEDYFKGIRLQKIIYMIFFIFSLNFFGNVYAMRQIFKESFVKIENITLPSILLRKDINSDQFLD